MSYHEVGLSTTRRLKRGAGDISFVAADSYHPVVPLVIQLTEPVMRPFRRRLPAIGGIDFSPMVVLLVITLARVLIASPLLDIGLELARG